MYIPYITSIKECFPDTKIVIDTFHIIQLISRSLNKTRIKVMKSDKANYRNFKRYWRLLLTYGFDLDCSSWRECKIKCVSWYKATRFYSDIIKERGKI